MSIYNVMGPFHGLTVSHAGHDSTFSLRWCALSARPEFAILFQKLRRTWLVSLVLLIIGISTCCSLRSFIRAIIVVHLWKFIEMFNINRLPWSHTFLDGLHLGPNTDNNLCIEYTTV